MAVFPPGDAREDWKIVRALSQAVGHTLPFDSLRDVRVRMIEVNPLFAGIDQIAPAEWAEFGTPDGAVDPAPFTPPLDNFYMTDPISRASKTMAECTEAFGLGAKGGATGTDG